MSVQRAPEDGYMSYSDSLWLEGQPLASGRDQQEHCSQRSATQSSTEKAVVVVEGFREAKEACSLEEAQPGERFIFFSFYLSLGGVCQVWLEGLLLSW